MQTFSATKNYLNKRRKVLKALKKIIVTFQECERAKIFAGSIFLAPASQSNF